MKKLIPVTVISIISLFLGYSLYFLIKNIIEYPNNGLLLMMYISAGYVMLMVLSILGYIYDNYPSFVSFIDRFISSLAFIYFISVIYFILKFTF